MLHQRNPFQFATPTLLERAYQRLRFRECYSQRDLAPKLTPGQEEIVETLRREGTVTLERYIAPETLAAMRREMQQALEALEFETPCLAQTRIDPERHRGLIDNFLLGTPEELRAAGVAFDREEARSLEQVLADFMPSTLTVYMLERSPTFRDVWLDPYLLGIVAEYMGMMPKLAEAYVRRNYPAAWRTMNHFWHRDLNNKQTLCKMFVFLTDCAVDNGPHEFIKGSHTDYSRLNGKRYFSDQEVDAHYPVGHAQRLVSEVPAGSIILEDTRGAHRARMPERGYRDLGYAVFMPLESRYGIAHYTFPRQAAERLSPGQRAVIPEANLR